MKIRTIKTPTGNRFARVLASGKLRFISKRAASASRSSSSTPTRRTTRRTTVAKTNGTRRRKSWTLRLVDLVGLLVVGGTALGDAGRFHFQQAVTGQGAFFGNMSAAAGDLVKNVREKPLPVVGTAVGYGVLRKAVPHVSMRVPLIPQNVRVGI